MHHHINKKKKKKKKTKQKSKKKKIEKKFKKKKPPVMCAHDWIDMFKSIRTLWSPIFECSSPLGWWRRNVERLRKDGEGRSTFQSFTLGLASGIRCLEYGIMGEYRGVRGR